MELTRLIVKGGVISPGELKEIVTMSMEQCGACGPALPRWAFACCCHRCLPIWTPLPCFECAWCRSWRRRIHWQPSSVPSRATRLSPTSSWCCPIRLHRTPGTSALSVRGFGASSTLDGALTFCLPDLAGAECRSTWCSSTLQAAIWSN